MSVTGHTPPGENVGVESGANARMSIRDVARAAGVSHQTVSRVLNDHPYVSEDARRRVADAMEHLHYRPSRAAQDLARGSSNTVTVLTSNTHLYGYSQTLTGIEEAAREAGAQVAIRVLDMTRGQSVEQAVAEVSTPGSGALVVLAFDRIGAAALRAVPQGVRWATAAESRLGRKAEPDQTERWAWYDDMAIARTATEHLLDLGHESVHHLTIPSSARMSDRTRGWLQAHEARGIAVPAPVKSRDWGIDSAYRSAQVLLEDSKVTAVLCGNDDQALGVMRAAHEMAIDIPGQLSIVGFDDVPAAAYLTPALTTVRFDFVALGRRTFELLQPRSSDATDGRELPEPRLIVRESTAQRGAR